MKKLIIFVVSFLLLLNITSAAIGVSGEFEVNGEFGNGIRNVEIDEGESIRFDAVFTSDAYPVTYSISLRDNDGRIIHSYANELEVDQEELIYREVYEILPRHYEEAGDYNIIINAEDDENEAGFIILNLNINELNEIPTAIIDAPEENLEVIVDTALFFSGHGVDPDGDDIEGYRWAVDGIFLNNEQEFNFYFNELGEHIFTFSVYDGESWSTNNPSVTINVVEEVNNAPIAIIDAPQDNLRTDVGVFIEFEGHGVDPDGDEISAYSWNFGDGIGAIIQDPIYSYDEAGNYEVSFRVQDEHGMWSEATTINVIISEDENIAPIVIIENPEEGENIDGVYNIEWYSEDRDGEVVDTEIYYKRHVGIPIIHWFTNLFNDYTLLVDLGDSNQRNYNWDTTRLRDGDYSLAIVVTDNEDAEGYDRVNVKIDNFRDDNNAPRIISEPVTRVNVNKIYRYDVDAVDPDGDEIVYRLRNAPNGMRINSETGVITWRPRIVGNYNNIIVTASDGQSSDSQRFTIYVTVEGISIEKIREVHEFTISNMILHQDKYNLNVYVQIKNTGNQKEKVLLRATNMQTGDIIYDYFWLENQDNYWRILPLPKPTERGIYTVGVWGNSKDYKDTLYREIIVS